MNTSNTLLVILICLSFYQVQGQDLPRGYYVLTNNRNIPYTKIVKDQDPSDKKLLVLNTEGETIRIDPDSILGYFIKSPKSVLLDKGNFFYYKRLRGEKDSARYEYVTKVKSGAVNLYKHTAYFYGSYGATARVTYYIEKHGIPLKEIFLQDALGQNKKQILEELKEFIGDNQAVLNSLPDRVHHRDSLLEFVRRYNVAEFRESEVPEGDLKAKAIIYCKRNPDQLPLTIGNKRFDFGTSDVVTYEIPANHAIKLCLGDGEFCDVVEIPPYYDSYFEIEIIKTTKKTYYKLEPQPTLIGERETSMINRKKEKRNK